MFFPTAGIEVDVWLPPLAALTVSFFTSMGGVSGAFLLLPFQVTVLGYTQPSVSATNQLYNMIAIPGGVYRYWKEGRMVWPLTVMVVIGTLPGVMLGAWVRIRFLPDPRHFKLFAAAVLLYIGFRLAGDLLRLGQTPTGGRAGRLSQRQRGASSSGSTGKVASGPATVEIRRFDRYRIVYGFEGKDYDVPCWGIFLLSLVVGIAGGIYGIGGGAIIAPFFVTFFRLPVHTVAGASLMGTFITSIAAVLFYQALAQFYPQQSVAPDWWLGILFGVGGLVGIYLGARCQKFMPAKAIKGMLTFIAIATAAKYIIEFWR